MVMDVRTGELLAVSSQPTTNINNLKAIKMLDLHNRALSSVYEPGSVMKPLIAAIGIEEGKYLHQIHSSIVRVVLGIKREKSSR